MKSTAQPWTTEELRIALESNLKPRQIAKKLGRSIAAVYSVRNRASITPQSYFLQHDYSAGIALQRIWHNVVAANQSTFEKTA